MAHKVSSPSLGSSSAHQGVHTIVPPPSANQAFLDLNLSQKASHNPKGHDETDSPHHKTFDASASSQPESVTKGADVLTSNGCIVPNAEGISEQIDKQEHAHPQQNLDTDSAAARTALNEPSIKLAAEGLAVTNELAPTSAAQKRKIARVEAASNAKKELKRGTAVLGNVSPLVNEPMSPCPGLKRKSRCVKQISETTKKMILALEANDDEGLAKPRGKPRRTTDMSKDMVLDSLHSESESFATPDLAERHLLLEERKIRLVEQRFALEEKKLEATIEIGKGLIVSMERMTTTITNLGNSSSHHR